MDYILTIDTGSSSSKLALFDISGTLVALVRKVTKVRAEETHNSLREYDPLLWWESTAEGIIEILETSHISSKQIAAVGLSGQIGTHLLLDDKKKPLTCAISWQDGRAFKEAQWLETHYKTEILDSILGMHLPPGTAWPIPRLLWLKKHRSDLFEQSFTLLQTKEYIAFKLTGILKTDILSLRGLVNPIKKELDTIVSHEILKIPDLQNRIPEFGEATDLLGHITSEASQKTGLLQGTPVITGCGDFHASLVGSGIIDDQYAFNITGTSDHIGYLVRTTNNDAFDKRLGRYPSVVKDWDIWYGATSAGGGSFQWFLESFGERIKGQTIKAYVEEMLKEIPEPSPMLYLPYLNGERAPIWNADARAGFVGFSAAHTKAHFLKSVLEGVCFSLKDCYSLMQDIQETPSLLRVSGAAGADHIWNQMKADILQINLQSMECLESSSLGAAILACVGIGMFPTIEEASLKMVRSNRTYLPNPEYEHTYKAMFGIYKQLYQNLKPIFEELSTLRSKL